MGPVILGWDLIVSARGSISRLNIEGEKGQPCLVPLQMENALDRTFDVYTCAHGEE